MRAIDLFAGPGGWDVGAYDLGIEPLGIEWDDAACETRRAAGLPTHQADVSELDPVAFYGLAHGAGWRDKGPLDLLIASPPCQAWSMAGKREGQKDIEAVYALTNQIAAGIDRECGVEWADDRSKLVTEPIRWTKALRPRFLAWEQVPPVLDYWRFCAGILRDWGYSVWTGILSAERYGVPQTRRRAILMASLDGAVEPPRPTHQAYVPGEPAWTEPQLSLEGELLPWVSMAEALGWGMAEAPYPAVASGRETGGPDKEKVGGSGARKRIYRERESLGAEIRVGFPRRADGGAMTEDGKRERDFRNGDQPAFNLTEKARSWQFRAGGVSGQTPRSE